MYNLGVYFKGKDGVSPSLRNITRNSKAAGAAAFSAGKKIQGLFKGGMLGSGMGGMGGVIAATGGIYGLGRAFGYVIKKTAEFETSRTKLNVLYGSQEAGLRAVRDMARAAVDTTLELSDIMKAGIVLKAGGVDNVMKRMMQLGDIAVGNKENFQDLVRAYQVSMARDVGENSRGILLRQIQMFATAGTPVYKAIQNLFPSEDIFTKIRQGEFKPEYFNKILDSLTGKGGMFHQAMAKQMGTLGGQYSNLDDVLGVLAATFGSSFLDGMKNVILQTRLKMNELIDHIINSKDSINKSLGSMFQSFAALISAIKPEAVGKFFSNLYKILKIGIPLIAIFKTFSIIMSTLGSVMMVFGMAQFIFAGGVTAALAPVILTVLALAAAIGLVVYAMGKMGLIDTSWATNLKGQIGDFAEEYKKSLSGPDMNLGGLPAGAYVSQQDVNVQLTVPQETVIEQQGESDRILIKRIGESGLAYGR